MSGGVLDGPRVGSDAFPAPALPGFDPLDWTSRSRKEHQGLTGYLDDVMCNANGPSTPGLLDSLTVSVNRSIAFQHAKTLGPAINDKGRQETMPLNRTHCGAQYRSGRDATPLPFILTTFLCTLQPATSAIRLIRKLKHSILGLWLAVTQAGVTPARLRTISSPHLHSMVRPASLKRVFVAGWLFREFDRRSCVNHRRPFR